MQQHAATMQKHQLGAEQQEEEQQDTVFKTAPYTGCRFRARSFARTTRYARHAHGTRNTISRFVDNVLVNLRPLWHRHQQLHGCIIFHCRPHNSITESMQTSDRQHTGRKKAHTLSALKLFVDARARTCFCVVFDGTNGKMLEASQSSHTHVCTGKTLPTLLCPGCGSYAG